MKSIAIPKFSDRYQALVDAERQYVVNSQQQARRARRQGDEGATVGQAGLAPSVSGIGAVVRLLGTPSRAGNKIDGVASS